jgi:hypothetical protein
MDQVSHFLEHDNDKQKDRLLKINWNYGLQAATGLKIVVLLRMTDSL